MLLESFTKPVRVLFDEAKYITIPEFIQSDLGKCSYVTKVNGRTTEPSKNGLRPRVTVELGDDLGFFNKQIGLK